jgi:hypothetical protein
VGKHINSKHYDKLCAEPRVKEYFEQEMHKNYCADENRFTNQPNDNSALFSASNPRYHKHLSSRNEAFEQKRKAKVIRRTTY